MNKRLIAIAETACLEPSPELQKFAELVIEECTTVVNSQIGRRIGEIDIARLFNFHFYHTQP